MRGASNSLMMIMIHIKNKWRCLKKKKLKLIVILSELNKNPVEGFSAGLVDESDIHKWEVLIIGPPDTL